jgi:hypothetical protein
MRGKPHFVIAVKAIAIYLAEVATQAQGTMEALLVIR